MLIATQLAFSKGCVALCKVDVSVESVVHNKVADAIFESYTVKLIREIAFYYSIIKIILGEIVSLIFGIFELIPIFPFITRDISIIS